MKRDQKSSQRYLKFSDEEEIGKTCLAQRRKGRQGDGPRPVIPSECEGSKKKISPFGRNDKGLSLRAWRLGATTFFENSIGR
jgi:hypothetical protein